MIAIFTDFGIQGPYLGQMHAVLAAQAPSIPAVDLFPDLPPFNVRAAAYLLPAYSQYLPDTAICLCVVDPGVGSARRPLALQADGRWYVGPDNGLFSIVMRRASQVRARLITLIPERLSASFHGRDLFAPVAAGIACGEDCPGEAVGADTLVAPPWPDELPEILYVDHYGNAVTGVRAEALGRDAVVEVAGRRCAFRRTFAEAATGEAFWYPNANGLVEVALNQGSAAQQLGLAVGMQIGVSI
jgi:S-adenosylmethionine hydrolase